VHSRKKAGRCDRAPADPPYSREELKKKYAFANNASDDDVVPLFEGGFDPPPPAREMHQRGCGAARRIRLRFDSGAAQAFRRVGPGTRSPAMPSRTRAEEKCDRRCSRYGPFIATVSARSSLRCCWPGAAPISVLRHRKSRPIFFVLNVARLTHLSEEVSSMRP